MHNAYGNLAWYVLHVCHVAKWFAIQSLKIIHVYVKYMTGGAIDDT